MCFVFHARPIFITNDYLYKADDYCCSSQHDHLENSILALDFWPRYLSVPYQALSWRLLLVLLLLVLLLLLFVLLLLVLLLNPNSPLLIPPKMQNVHSLHKDSLNISLMFHKGEQKSWYFGKSESNCQSMSNLLKVFSIQVLLWCERLVISGQFGEWGTLKVWPSDSAAELGSRLLLLEL